MTNQQILATLRKHDIKTVGDLDSWARVRKLSRWEALGVLVGVEAADRVLGALAVRMTRREATA